MLGSETLNEVIVVFSDTLKPVWGGKNLFQLTLTIPSLREVRAGTQGRSSKQRPSGKAAYWFSLRPLSPGLATKDGLTHRESSWWHTSLIPALSMQRPRALCESEASTT